MWSLKRDDGDRQPGGSLEVRSRKTVHRDGQVSTHQSVHCPQRDTTVSVRECVLCTHCEGMYSADGQTYMTCTRASADDGGPPRRRRRPTGAEQVALPAVMTGDVVCVRPDLGLDALSALLVDRGISGAPVIDDDGRAVGIVSRSDLIRARVEQGDSGFAEDTPVMGDEWPGPGFHLLPSDGDTVADIMMPISFSLPENASLSQAAALMAYENVHRVPVVATDGSIVGIVSTLDVVRWLAHQDGYAVPHPPDRPHSPRPSRALGFDRNE